MSKITHRIYLGILVAIVFVSLILLVNRGMSYYRLPIEERVFAADHSVLKPSGVLGHGMGILGSLLIIIGVSVYMARKRYRFLSRVGLLKYWLEFHIFLCTLGPILVLFHTAFKFGGLVAISFWSMVAVFMSGIIGRFIYLQIPHSIEGRELSLSEVRGMKTDIVAIVRSTFNLDEESYKTLADSLNKRFEPIHANPVIRYFRKYFDDRRSFRTVKTVLKKDRLHGAERRKILALIKNDISLSRRIDHLDTMQKFFKYWHVIHLPFALVMLIIMVIHVAVTIVFGYRWIF